MSEKQINLIEIEIPGKPKGKGRPRFTRSGHIYTPKDTAEYEKLVRDIYRHSYGGFMFNKGVPIVISITAYYPIPKNKAKQVKAAIQSLSPIVPVTKPDADNIAKIVCDALNGVAYYDDAQITKLSIAKKYSECPRTLVRVYER